jgi:glycine C-acetyltransferase
MSKKLRDFLSKELQNLSAAGLMVEGPVLTSPQGNAIKVGAKELLNFASDDYLGWTHDSRLKEAAAKALDDLGNGFASGRLSTGTHSSHQKLEKSVANLLALEDSLLYASSFEAGLGIFESLFGEDDYLFCDYSLHPSLVDGVRLSSATNLIFKSHDLSDLEDKLKRSSNARFRAIVVGSVSPQDGRLAPVPEILELAKRYDALTIVDDSLGIGVLGRMGRGITEELEILGAVDLVKGAFGHALGGEAGGFVAGRKDLVSWLRQKSRPYLFSDGMPPASVAAAQKAVDLLSRDILTAEELKKSEVKSGSSNSELARLKENTDQMRVGLERHGYQVIKSSHPIISIVVKDALLCQKMADRLYQKGIFVLGFCYPVVPKGSARIRLQVSAQHLKKDLSQTLETFYDVGKSLGVI